MSKDKTIWDNLYYSLRDMTSATIVIIVIVLLAGIRIAHLEQNLKAAERQIRLYQIQVDEMQQYPEFLAKAYKTCTTPSQVPGEWLRECLAYEIMEQQ